MQGLELKVFPGHGQPEPLDENGGIFRATVDGQQEGWYNPDQYSNPEVRLLVALRPLFYSVTKYHTELRSACPLDRAPDSQTAP